MTVAKAHELELTPEQVKEILDVVSSDELSDEQLNRISGGYYLVC